MGILAVLMTITLSAWASAIHGINDVLDHERIAQRSERMAEMLRDQAQQAEQSESIADLRDISANAEWIMTTENHEWLASLGFHRPPIVPT